MNLHGMQCETVFLGRTPFVGTRNTILLVVLVSLSSRQVVEVPVQTHVPVPMIQKVQKAPTCREFFGAKGETLGKSTRKIWSFIFCNQQKVPIENNPV